MVANKHVVNLPNILESGKLPPQAVEVEEAVLAALLLESEAYYTNPVKEEWFYKNEHQVVIGAIKKLAGKNRPIDLLQVRQELKDSGMLEQVGGAVYLMQVIQKVSSAAHIEHHIRIIHDKYVRRQAISIAHKIANAAYDESVDEEELISMFQTEALSLGDFEQDNIKSIQQGIEDVMAQVKANQQSHGLLGIPTGLHKLDTFTGGWQGGDLVVVGGETSQGKTALVLGFVDAAAKAGYPCAIYSMEMALRQLSARLLSMNSGVNSKSILVKRLFDDDVQLLEDGISKIGDSPIYVDVNTRNNINSIIRSIRNMHIKYGTKLAIVDYIQMLQATELGQNEESIIADAVKKLKAIAMELDIVVFAISQFRRDAADPYPRISRMRGSGQVEEKADIIIMPYRPEYYNRQLPEPWQHLSPEGLAAVIIGKGRNIGVGKFLAAFEKEVVSFRNYDEQMHGINY